MAKGGKQSSATSATRKKHARRAAATEAGEMIPTVPKSKEKGKKRKEPRVKIYIAPVKPAPLQPDPIETSGLALSLPAPLLVVLRSFNKKAQQTKIRALEELQTTWVDQALREGKDGQLVYNLIQMLPVWLHHFPALLVHPSRRVRYLTAMLQASLMQFSPTRDQIIAFLRRTASASQVENILGTWCMAAHDIDRHTSSLASKSWRSALFMDGSENLDGSEVIPPITAFIERAVLDPGEIYSYLNPPPPTSVPQPITKQGNRNLPPPRNDDADLRLRSKGEQSEENVQDRNARLRVGAFGSLQWMLENSGTTSESLHHLLTNPALWSSLYHAEQCPWVDMEGFGFSQPAVRKAAWTFLQTLLSTYTDVISMVPILGSAVLRSAWVEPDPNVQMTMWQPLLVLLRDHPEAWMEESQHSKQQKTNDDDSDSEDDESGVNTPSSPNIPGEVNSSSAAYDEFLQFLQLGCSGSPIQGYPTLVVILSTIPSSIIATKERDSSLSGFFTSFWAAVDGRALSSLNRAAASAAFMSSLLECTVCLVQRLRSDDLQSRKGLTSEATNVNDIERAIVREQISRTCEELFGRRLKVEEKTAGQLFGQTFMTLHELDEGLFTEAWNAFARALKDGSESNTATVSVILNSLSEQFREESVMKRTTKALLSDVITTAVDRCTYSLRLKVLEGIDAPAESFRLLVSMLEEYKEKLFDDNTFCEKLDELVSQHAYAILNISPALLLSYLSYRSNETKCLLSWHSVLRGVPQEPSLAEKPLKPLLDSVRQGVLPKYLKPGPQSLDGLAGQLLRSALSSHGTESNLTFSRQLLQMSDYFISEAAFTALIQNIVSAFNAQFDLIIKGETVDLSPFDLPLDLLSSVSDSLTGRVCSQEIFFSALPNIFLYAYLIPACIDEDDLPSVAFGKSIWSAFVAKDIQEQTTVITTTIKAQLKGYLLDTEVLPLPSDILKMVSASPPCLDVDILADLFPSLGEMNALLDALPAESIHRSMGVTDPLLPSASSSKKNSLTSSSVDHRGYGPYARVTHALLQVLSADRPLAKKNIWTLRHFIALFWFACDFQSVPFAPSPVFSKAASTSALSDLISKINQIIVYLLKSSSTEGWQAIALKALLNDTPEHDLPALPRFLVDTVNQARQNDTPRDLRIIKKVFHNLFDGVDKTEADSWILFARKIEKYAPNTSIYITAAVTMSGVEPPRLDRYRNELAAAMLGVLPQDVNTEGLLTLRKLSALSPDPHSDVVFLPQLRAVNVVKACQNLVASEEDIEEDFESIMTELFLHLVPILQTVPGAHWDFIYDLIESNLEHVSITDSDSLVLLARTLRLAIAIRDLTLFNKSLLTDWKEHQMTILASVKQMAAERIGLPDVSAPRSVCRELVLCLVQDLPESLIDKDTFSQMCHLITDHSNDVQKESYQLLRTSAGKRTELLVIEAGVDLDASFQAELPAELVEILLQSINTAPDEDEQTTFGYMLGWLLLFDLFRDASFRVRSGYIEQLRNLDLVVAHFIPLILTALHLDEGIGKAFKLDIWNVEEFHIQFYEIGTSFAVPVLAAHLYYRALINIPSLIHTWILDCKDRQLSSTVTSYTSQYFSPVIIRAELENVKSRASQEGLVDDNFAVKVSSNINEVVASYLVDESQFEIRFRIPKDWPLHKLEVRDLRMVGVEEKRWRAWILSVQQMIWSHNGRIVDGIGIFKKNVTSYFEGQPECAICYSVISVTDGSFPRKPCKTCKNRFHAGCLYKWFSTSHTSKCPLCRSDII